MTRNELNRFQRLLTARIAELQDLIRRREGITVERSADVLEEIQGAAERALAVGHLDRDFSQLRDARAALRRIEDGSFGTCQECDQEIHPKRLAAVPWAGLCIRCQEASDRGPDEIRPATRVHLALAA